MTNKEKVNILMEFIKFRMEIERKLKSFEKVISGGNDKLELDALLNVLEDAGFFENNKKNK